MSDLEIFLLFVVAGLVVALTVVAVAAGRWHGKADRLSRRVNTLVTKIEGGYVGNWDWRQGLESKVKSLGYGNKVLSEQNRTLREELADARAFLFLRAKDRAYGKFSKEDVQEAFERTRTRKVARTFDPATGVTTFEFPKVEHKDPADA